MWGNVVCGCNAAVTARRMWHVRRHRVGRGQGQASQGAARWLLLALRVIPPSFQVKALDKPCHAELGAASPYIIVPGQWTDSELKMQGLALLGWMVGWLVGSHPLCFCRAIAPSLLLPRHHLDLLLAAKLLLGLKTFNASHICASPQTIVMDRQWPLAQKFVAEIEAAVPRLPVGACLASCMRALN